MHTPSPVHAETVSAPVQEKDQAVRTSSPVPLPEIPFVLEIDRKKFTEALASVRPASKAAYDLVLDAMQIRFKETFDHLLCLNTLSGITSLIFQEETARKILKTFRGRALLSDEVGMGKTIEACMVLKEYMMRQMVKSVLILVPTPLVSQWREELKTKFNLAFSSTDDPAARAEGDAFWDHPHIVASINLAKSAKNFSSVINREYDLVIVDEAHHLKNRNTLNWKLVNTLKKRFLLLLTATPVENNLIELYNLITLLKPGQLKTESAFKGEFMTKGDPTDPQNRAQLKGLLDQVMIRNTRSVSNIRIPPRFAETIRTDPTPHETELYERVSGLVKDINHSNGAGKKMILKHLLAEAGSSPAAVGKTLSELIGNRDLTAGQENEIRAINTLTRSMGETGKNNMALKLIRASDDKIIIFVKYRATLDHLSDLLAWHGIPHSLFHGRMPNEKKDEEIERFKADRKILLSTELGGEGRNLQFCHQMINYDLPWNPMRIEQRIGRIHRIGQQNQVMIYNLCMACSIEDYILEILDKKINMFEMVIGEVDMIIGRLRGEQDFSDIIYDIWVNSASEQDRMESFTKLGSQLKRCKTGYEKTKSFDEKLFGVNYEI
jgi:SNF2 family DNA or RNA helicase